MCAKTMFLAMLGLGVFGVATAQAADKYWNNTGTDLNAAASWTGGAPGTGDKAVFNAAAATQPQLTASRTIQGLVLAPNTTTTTVPGPEGGGYTLSGATATKLTLTLGGTYSGARPIYQNTTGTNTITADLELSSSTARREFEVRSGAIALAGVLSSVGNAEVAFAGQTGTQLTLSGGNTFTGSFEHRGAGYLKIVNPNALSTATLRLGSHGAAWAYMDNLTGADLTLPGNNPLELFGGDGIRFVGTHGLNVGTGTVTLAEPTDSGRNCPLHVLGARLVFGGPVGEVPTARHGLQKFGPGTLELRAASSYLAATYVNGGVLLLTQAGTIGSSNLVLRGTLDGNIGVLGLGNGNFTRPLGTRPGQVAWVGGGGYYASGGFAAYGADRTVNLGGTSASVKWGTTNFCGGIFVLGAADADAMVDFTNPVELHSSERTIHVADGSAEVDGRLSGVLSGPVALAKTGAGTLELAADNTHAGELKVNDGRVLVSGSTSTGAVTVNAAGTLGGAGTINGNVGVSGTLSPGSGAGTLVLKKNLTLQAGARMRFDVGAAADKVALAGTSQAISNLGAVSCEFVLGAGFNPSGTYVLLDWSGATTPNVTALDAADFTLENVDVLATFAVVESTLVVNFKPLLSPATVIVVY